MGNVARDSFPPPSAKENAFIDGPSPGPIFDGACRHRRSVVKAFTRVTVALVGCLAAPVFVHSASLPPAPAATAAASASTVAAAGARPPLPAMVDTPCQAEEPTPPPLAALMKSWLASPTERAALIKSISPAEMARIPAMVAKRHQDEIDQKARDWPNLCKYRALNRNVIAAGRPDVVFMGDSITEFWKTNDQFMFNDRIVDRGISGQTSPQMLARFMPDVVSLRPRVVHILAGTNDVAGNTGPNSPQDYENNIRAMVALAQANGIAVVIGSILPANRFTWRPDLRPADQILALNRWLRAFAVEKHLGYVDYYAALVDDKGGFRARLSNDGVHPNSEGYAIMRPLAVAAIASAKSR